jgi:hypothetical protein
MLDLLDSLNTRAPVYCLMACADCRSCRPARLRPGRIWPEPSLAYSFRSRPARLDSKSLLCSTCPLTSLARLVLLARTPARSTHGRPIRRRTPRVRPRPLPSHVPCDILNEPFTPSVLNTLGLRLLHFERPDVDVILTVSGHSCPHLRSAFYAYTSNDLFCVLCLHLERPGGTAPRCILWLAFGPCSDHAQPAHPVTTHPTTCYPR